MGNQLQKREESIKRILDWLSLGSVLQYATYRFLQSTMFVIYYSQVYKLITMGLLILFGGARYLYIIIGKRKGYEDKREKNGFIIRCCGTWLLALPFFYVGWKHDYKVLIFLPICCMCLYDMEAEKVLKWFTLTIGILFSATILCCLSGTVRNLVIPWWRRTGAFGFVNSSDMASYFTFLSLTFWCIIRNKRLIYCLLYSVFVGTASYVVWWYTDSKTVLVCGILTILVILWDSISKIIIQNRSIGRHINLASVIVYPIILIGIIILVVGYGHQEPWVQKAEQVLNGRLSTIWNPLQSYGINAFGTKIESMHGVGGTNIQAGWSSGYTYLDVAYAMLAIRYGWVITAIVSSIWIWMTIKALRFGKEKIAFAMAVLAVHAFSEARFLDVNYNIFLIMPFCALQNVRKEQSEETASKKVLFSIMACLGITGGIYLILPRLLSWLRTLFYINGWNTGTATICALATCAGIIALVVLLWKGIIICRFQRDRKAIIFLINVIFVISGSGLLIDKAIERGYKEQVYRIEVERKIIQQVLGMSSQPVYAAEASELYIRDGLGVSDHLFSPDELGRVNGSLFVDKNTEVFGVVRSGGLYTQLTEWSGLYSYDPDVINGLSEMGFEWKPFYSGKRSINLNDAAVFNGLRGENLVLRDNARIITSNMETDQFSGSYEVCFDLTMAPDIRVGGTVILEVIGEAGEKTIVREILKDQDFDKDGRCSYSIVYQISDTPKVSYAISVLEGVSITVNNISWQRIS